MACYIVGAMSGAAYDFKLSSTMGVIITVIVIILGEIMPVEKDAGQH